jgi:hypothetical protein
MRFPTSQEMQLDNLHQCAVTLPVGVLRPTRITSCDPPRGKFRFSDDPTLMAALASYLQRQKRTSLGKLDEYLSVIENNPMASGSQMSGFLLEIAVGLALTEASLSTAEDAFLMDMQRYSHWRCPLPGIWARLFKRVHIAPQCVSLCADKRKFPSVCGLLQAVAALESGTFFNFCLELFLFDTNAGPDQIWFVGLRRNDANPGDAGFLVMFLVGLKWYGRSILDD